MHVCVGVGGCGCGCVGVRACVLAKKGTCMHVVRACVFARVLEFMHARVYVCV